MTEASQRRHGAFTTSGEGSSSSDDARLSPAQAAARLREMDAQRSKHGHQLATMLPDSTIAQWKFLTPLVWAPLFPVIRMTTGRLSKRAQPWALGLAIAVANLHGFWLINNPDLSEL